MPDAADFVAACSRARDAQRDWAATPAPRRGRAIQQIGRIVEANKEALARVMTAEMGKPIAESRGEVQEVIDTADFFLGEGRRLYGQTVPSEMADKQLFTFRNPVGVAAIITAGNFPTAVPAWYLIPALLCGNAVVWKPAEYTPEIGRALTSLFQAGGLPEGVLNTVIADGPATFEGLEQALGQGLVDKVGFTGSSAVGSKIGELCGRHLQNPCLELGGKNPLVVMDDADLDLAVEGALFSGFGTAGQRCTSMGTAIVHESVHDDFLARFTTATEGAVVGDPFEDVLYGPMINQRFADRFEEWLGLVEDHHDVSGSSATGRITADNPRDGFVGDPAEGLYFHPTIVAGVTAGDAIYSTETFGPIVGVARFGDFDEAVELANGHGYGLSAAIYTSDAAHALKFRQRVSAGMLSVNNSTSGAEAHLPFGGNGKSGNGSRLSGMWVLDQFTRWQSMNWDYAGKLQKAQMDIDDVEADLDFRL
ncbi:MAG TPA: aldehyde dehydrogenase family protein [Thermoleophilaceae bacterium]|nr:aldehyde dehydrogenase family protein [Thermoleophilaceae bacterium]